MKLAFLLPLVLSAISTHAHPISLTRRGSVGVLDDVLLFDALAFPDPSNPANTVVSLQAFVSLRAINLGGLTSGLQSALNAIGLHVGNDLVTIQKRIRLFGAVGVSGKDVTVNVNGCSAPAKVSGTSGLPDLGLALQEVSVGTCAGAVGALYAQGATSGLDSRPFNATVFASPDSGFGVISGSFPNLALYVDVGLTFLLSHQTSTTP